MAVRRIVRLSLFVLIVGSVVYLGISYAESDVRKTTNQIQRIHETGANTPIAPSRDNVTLVVSDRRFQGLVNSAVMAFAPNGSLLYYSDNFSNYHDIDPSPEGRQTVFIVASNLRPSAQCSSNHPCTRNVFQEINLTTGKTTTLYSNISTKKGSRDWHDADRINETYYVVADIERDRLFIVNTKTDRITWQWSVNSTYSHNSGGAYPSDWTHMNDVEYLADGRIMASLRNHDQVVFIKPGKGLLANWTLGTDDDHGTLFEAHNPDYIPQARGGPAILVADSENDRVIEYQRVRNKWEASWIYTDSRMEWPRDADRLPNGHTLISDSNAGRVFEVNRQGDIVWKVNVSMPYEAERLGTGDESQGGESAVAANLTAVADGKELTKVQIAAATQEQERDLDVFGSIDDRLKDKSFRYLWSLSTSGLLFITPEWIAVQELGVGMVLVMSTLLWACLEGFWRLKRHR